MPAFDPVRDAVLNSPIDKHTAYFHLLPSSSSSSTASNNNNLPSSTTTTPSSLFPPSPLASPSLARRATDLAVLLNADSSQPLRTPPTMRASTLSHLLHNDINTEDKLATSEPLRRSTNRAPGITHSPLPEQLTRSSSPLRIYNTTSPTSRPSLSPSLLTMKPASPPPPSTIPYNPKQRLTPAGSVLEPMSQTEMEMFKNYRGQGSTRLMKRKRSVSAEPDDHPQKRHAGDVGVVVNHYNSRPDVGVEQRLESPIIGLKNFNNWVKSVLITRFAHPALAHNGTGNSRGRGSHGKVLDMGCGKGGDMTKWAKARVRELIGVDIASVSVDQARSRWESLRPPRFEATFAALDCYTEPLLKGITPAKLSSQFDVVSMQFCMHYAFETVQKARCMLDNVSRYLRTGGVFIGTIPNADLLLDHLDAIPPDAEELSFGNSVYKIRFEERGKKPVFGHKYWFFLKDAVENVPEYVVRWENFVQMAADYQLFPVYKAEFHQVFEEHQEHPEFGPLMVRMKVVDANGESAMDEDQWEAANIYIAFAFEKR